MPSTRANNKVSLIAVATLMRPQHTRRCISDDSSARPTTSTAGPAEDAGMPLSQAALTALAPSGLPLRTTLTLESAILYCDSMLNRISTCFEAVYRKTTSTQLLCSSGSRASLPSPRTNPSPLQMRLPVRAAGKESGRLWADELLCSQSGLRDMTPTL